GASHGALNYLHRPLTSSRLQVRERGDNQLGGHAQLLFAEGRGRRLLAYRSCTSPNQVPLQRPVSNKEKARGASWAVIKESTVLHQTRRQDTPAHPYFRFLASSSLSEESQ
ncbi:hypothetical protein PoB_001358000, partial [Plakobranchus ocellatus]